MDKIIGICNLHDDPRLAGLTSKRSLGSISFLGRYGLMDFTLSNFTNSGINKIFVLAAGYAQSVRAHIGSGNIWISNTRTGYLKLLLNETVSQTSKFNTDIANLLESYQTLEVPNCDYVVVAPAFFLQSIDYREVLEAHKQSGAKITIVYKHVKNAREEYLNCDALTLEGNKVVESFKNDGAEDVRDISLESFIFDKETFASMITTAKTLSSLFTVRKMVEYAINKDLFPVNAYEFKGYVVPVLTFNDYVKESIKLLDYENRKQLFHENWPIYTTTHNTPPAIYGATAEVSNSFVANGSEIHGTVKNSIISRDVTIEEGAVVENCILFTKTVVSKGTHLKNVVSDKNVNFAELKEVSGKEDDYLYIESGARI